MPILEVEVVEEAASAARNELAMKVADGVAEVLDARPGSVWVRLRFTPARDYAENAAPEERGGPSPLPVFVTVILRTWPEREEMERQARALSIAIGAACGRPSESVHVVYEPPGEGRVAFGGTLVE